MNNSSAVFYIKVDGSLLLEYTYSNEIDAANKARSLGLSNYTIIEWEID